VRDEMKLMTQPRKDWLYIKKFPFIFKEQGAMRGERGGGYHLIPQKKMSLYY
jgi:hypothetical protein